MVLKKATADAEKKTPSVIVEVRSGNCKLQNRGRPFKNERHKQFISYEKELQIPHSICAEISSESVLWRKAPRDRENTSSAMRMEKGENSGVWCRGYYIDTAGKNAKKIEEYIRHQLDEDKAGEQLTMGNY